MRVDGGSNELVLSVGDGANTLTFNLPVGDVNPFSMVLPAKFLVKLCKPAGRRETGMVAIEPTQDGITLTVEGVEHALLGDPSVSDSPTPVAAPGDWTLVAMWKASVARDALTFVQRAVSRDNTRPHLQAIYLTGKAAVAPDGHRLQMAPLPTSTEPLLVPSFSAATLQRLLAHGDYASLYSHDDRLRVQGERWVYETKLSKEQFPTRRTFEAGFGAHSRYSIDVGARLCGPAQVDAEWR